ncbi:MAG TPA: 2Fe-2S iron-sulfur cluster-binding protein, partial [Casimicrobiaceae bacterium]|nr:2Fe-2S iron-sulfur cluster-binding protein [Casimicrobiaceae bacterium]
MTQRWRLSDGGAIDRSRPLAFTYDGVRYEGYAGDTLASALLANGVHLVGRSFKYHRPRGIVTAGVEEPCALVQLGEGARSEPNMRATTIELFDGLVACSQNCWPSVRFDLGEIANMLSPLLPAGFYYKTFKWPPTPRWWMRYEHFIRRAAGMGRAASAPDPDRYEHQYAHCDVLVIGGGPAGLAAARRAADSGVRVIVCQQTTHFGDTSVDALAAHADVTLLPRTAAFGYYDGNLVAALERIVDHQPENSDGNPRQRLWMIRTKAVVLASGAIERGIAYGDNDLPGTFLAGAAHRYVTRYAVRLGSRAVVFTNNDSGYMAALALHHATIPVAAIVDARRESPSSDSWRARARYSGIDVRTGALIERAHGRHRVQRVKIVSRDGGNGATLDCDIVAVSGGYSPTVHLFSQARGTLRYDETTASFVPDASPMAIFPAGAVNGHCDVERAIADGEAAADAALARAGIPSRHASSTRAHERSDRLAVEPLWSVAASAHTKRFVDLQTDVTVGDIALAAREGYDASEHLKRYTTLGMGTDQGKTSNVLGLALLAREVGAPVTSIGTTTFRPPYTPVTLGAF